MTPALDIIIPVYNEGETIIQVLDSLDSCVKTPHRILICYDHDNDTTLDALNAYSHTVDIELVKNRTNGVKGAVLAGFEASRADAVLIFPADDTFNANIVDTMYHQFESGSDIVVASRFIPGGCMEGCPWLKALLVTVGAYTLFHFAKLPTRDPTSGFKLFSRKLLQATKIESPESWSFCLEIVVKCHRNGGQITEVPAKWFERRTGQSRFKVLKWLPLYLRWYFYAFFTPLVRKGP